MYDLVIVGGGPAGLSAGIYAMRAAMNAVLVEKGMPGGQVALTKEVENYPGIEEVGGFELCEKFLNHAKRYNLDIRESEVARVEPGVDFHEVVLVDGTRLNTHAVILAAGGSARKLGVPGEIEQYGKGVSYCATCDGFFFRGKTVVVVGGGDTALEDALYLSKICTKVYLAGRSSGAAASCSSACLPNRVSPWCSVPC
jgi:thioredoxin reductase (NADPH)